MKILVNNFRGMAPKMSNKALPNNNASVATNCRLRSGDLESFKGQTSILTLNKSGTTNTIYPLDRDGAVGGPFWLNWPSTQVAPDTTKIDVVRGNILSDTTERTFYTGATDVPLSGGKYRPKFTNIPLATTTPVKDTGYPYDWRLLGVPSPGTFNGSVSPPQPLTVTQTLAASLSYTTITDGSSLSGWTTIPTTAHNSVTVSNTVGNPLPSFDLFSDGTVPTDTYVYQDMGVLTGPGSLYWDYRIDSSSNLEEVSFVIGSDSSGNNGLLLRVPIGPLVAPVSLVLGNSISGWASINNNTTYGSTVFPSGSPLNSFGVFYRFQLDYFPVNGSFTEFNITLTIKQGVTTLYTNNFNNINVSGNTFFGVCQQFLGPSAGGINGYLDNVNLKQVKLLDNPAYEATAWTYTYVDDFGQESAPAPASRVVFIGPGITTVLTNFDTAGVTGYAIVSDNIYRAVTGTSTTQFQFEDNVPLSTTTYTDTKIDSQLGEVLPSDNWDLPPDDARHIVNLPNGITIIASKNQICPSVQYVPYAYPVSYRLATDFPVVAMIGLETMAIVLTEESAYLVIGSDPSTMSMSKITPEYGCVSKRSAVRWGNYGAVYASNQGLVVVGMQGAQLITDSFISKKEWAVNYIPSTIEGAIYEDMYYGFFKIGGIYLGFIFDQKDNGVGFVNLTVGSNASYSEHLNETLYITSGNRLLSWDTDGTTPMVYGWYSKVFQSPYPTSYGVAQVRGYGESSFPTTPTIQFFKDYPSIAYYSKTVTNSREFLLPATVGFNTQFSLSGVEPISYVQIAEDMVELS